ncbi:hypothetical protein L7F22_061741 [Adiantum nelumboides]|nr:hypothetical protein [Adiantum nelumboides]
MAGGTAAGKGKGKGKGEMRGKYFSPKAKQGRTPRPKTRLQLTRLAGVSEDESPAPPMRKSPTKLLVKGGKGMKEASAIVESTQALAPLIPERRTKSTSEDRQAVQRPGVGDEAEASANNNQGAGKQKGTTSEAVRSPKPRVQSIAKNKVGVEQQKETAVPSKVPPTEIKKAEKKQVCLGCREVSVGSQKPHEDIPAQKMQVVPNKGKEKAVSVGSQKPHEDILAQKTQGSEKGKKTAGSSEDPHMEKKKGKKKLGFEEPKETGMSSEAVESQIIHEHSAVEKMQGSKSTKGKGSFVKPTEKVQVPKEVKKPKRKDKSAAPNWSKASEQPMKRKLPLQAATVGSPSKRAKVERSAPIRTQERFQEVDRKYEVNRKAVERRAVIKALECWDCINKRHVRCSKDDFVQNFAASRMLKADLKKDAIIMKIRQGYERHQRVRVGYLSSKDEDTFEDSSNQLEEYEKRRPAKLTEKVKEEEKESDLVEIYDRDGGTGDDEDSKDDGEGSEDDGKGNEEGNCAESTDESDEGDGIGASMAGSDEGDGVGAKDEEAEASSDEEATPEPSGGVALASMKESFALRLSFASMDSLLDGNMY